MINTVNADHTIIAAVPAETRGEFIVTGVSPEGQYVTWRAGLGTAHDPTAWLYVGGHYFHGKSARSEALEDMLSRAGLIPEV